MIPLACRESAGQRHLPNADKIERGVSLTRPLDDRPLAVRRLLLNAHVYYILVVFPIRPEPDCLRDPVPTALLNESLGRYPYNVTTWWRSP